MSFVMLFAVIVVFLSFAVFFAFRRLLPLARPAGTRRPIRPSPALTPRAPPKSDPAIMPKIFISYRRDDAPFEAAWIRDQFVSHFGESDIFLDIDAIPVGTDFRREIDARVGNCDYLIAVIGKSWLTVRDENGQRRLDNPDDWVRLEIQAALNRKIPVIPLLLHDVGMPKRDELPNDLREFAYRQAHSIHVADRQHDIDKLIHDIDPREKAAGSREGSPRTPRT
jgi:hypothetical protein